MSLPDEHTFVMPPSWRSRLHYKRGGRRVPRITDTVPQQWARLRKDAPHLPESFVSADWSLADLVRLSQSLTTTRSWEIPPGHDALLRTLVAAGRLEDAVVLLVQLQSFHNLWLDRVPGLRQVGIGLALADDTVHAACIAHIETAWHTRPQGRLACSYLNPARADWRQQVVATPRHWSSNWVQATAASVDELDTLTLSPTPSLGSAETLYAELGPGVIPALQDWYQRAYNADTQASVARVLAVLPHDDATTALLAHSDDRGVKQLLPQHFERFPQRCVRLAAESKHKGVRMLLEGWVAQAPKAVNAVLDAIPADSSAAGLLRAIVEAQQPVLPEARADELPAVLADPPWLRKKKRTKGLPAMLEVPLPAAHAVLSPAEAVSAERVRAAIDNAAAYPELHLQWTESMWRHRSKWAGVLLRGDATAREQALRRMQEAPFHGEAALQLVLALAMELPESAGRILLGLRRHSPDVVAPLVVLASPDVAAFMLDALGKRSHRSVAFDWLRRHPAYAARFCLPLLVSKKAAARRKAEDALHILVQHGHSDTLRAAAASAGPAAVQVLDSVLDRDPLLVLPKRPPKTVAFLQAGALPRPRLKGRQTVVPIEAVTPLVACLAIHSAEQPYAGIAQLADTLDTESLARLSWSLFEQWLAAGAPAKDSWALSQLGTFGDDDVAHRLAPMVRRWPGESQHKRAVAGLDVLLQIGTDVALMHLDGVAQKVRYKGIKEAARQRISALATKLGLSREQLADRLVPTLGLDQSGTLPLDYGPRQFTVSFDEALKPVVRDADGKKRRSLPKPGKRDDAEKAVPAEARFKALKKAVRTLSSQQVHRLKQAFLHRRTWAAADFQRFLVDHPLLVHLVRRLVWATFDEDDVVHTFRVAEDRTFATVDDDPFTLPEGAQVGLFHPVYASADHTAAWVELFADYELLQPFEQLGRPANRLTAQEAGALEVNRHTDVAVEIGRLMGLRSQGWEYGEAMDAGVAHWLALPLPDGVYEVRMWLGGAGLWTGMGLSQDTDPTLGALTVQKVGEDSWTTRSGRPLGTLPRALLSELLTTLDTLAAE